MINIYKRIANPLDEECIIDNIIDAYTNNYNLYDGLVKSEEKIKGRFVVKYRDNFYLCLFNDWKYTIHRIREADYLKEPHRSEIIKLDNYLKTQNPTSTEDVMEIANGKRTDDKDIKELIESLRWNRIGEFSSWEHIDSSYIRMGLHKRQKTEHRLYINCDSTKTYLIGKKLIEKCEEKKMSYYFKFDPYGDRADTIVIYCDTHNLPSYVKIINEIIKEEDLASSLHRPPLLTGKINQYIGYGSEPQEENGKPTSFNIKREKHLNKCIREVTADFAYENLKRTMMKKTGEPATYKDYLIHSIISYIRERTIKYMKGTEEDKTRKGYSLKEVNSSFFDITLINTLEPRINEMIDEYRKGNVRYNIEVPFGKGKIYISELTIEEIFKKQINTIFRKSKKYKERLKDKIKRTAHKYDIDEESYSVDLSKCSVLGKGYTEESRTHRKVEVESIEEKPKTKRKIMNYKPMTDDEIEESRRKIGIIK